MKHEQPVQNNVELSTSRQNKNKPATSMPTAGGSQVQFKILVAIIGFGVLMLILKAAGLV